MRHPLWLQRTRLVIWHESLGMGTKEKTPVEKKDLHALLQATSSSPLRRATLHTPSSKKRPHSHVNRAVTAADYSLSAIKYNGFDLPALSEERLQLFVVKKSVGRNVL